MSRLDDLIRRHPLPTWRVAAWPVMAFLAVAVAWSLSARLDEVAVAAGEVVPQGKVKVIQHLEGGIIEHIFVSEGAHVREGDPLIRLDLATAGVNRNELQVRLDGEMLRRARLAAEVGGTPLALPADLAAKNPDVAAAEEEAYRTRQRGLASTQAVLAEQARQKQLEVQELEARRRAVANNLGLARERLAMSETLLADGLTARMEHLQLKAEVESLDGELRSLGQAVPRARAAVTEVDKRLKEGEVRFRREAHEQLEQSEHAIARLREVLAQATDQKVRADIRSPTGGIVKKLRYNTLGGVVKPGEPIMEIVPSDDKLVIEARLNPIDRGYVREGQSALVKITTYDFVRYGGLEGEVIHVAPDSTTDSAGRVYFDVTVATAGGNLGTEAAPLPISAGMQATIDIHTGSRTVAQYLIKPVLKLRHEAFRER
jgi:adhesin transport system membrane fusion protein